MKNRKWSNEDIKRLTVYYTETPPNIFSVKEVSVSLCRSEDAITLKAGKLGLTNAKRKVSDRTKLNMSRAQVLHFSNPKNRIRMSAQVKNYIKNNGHPKGMRGVRHTDETKAVISIKSIAAAKNRTEENEAKRVMKGLKTRAKNGTLAPPRNKATWKQGWREIGGYKKYYRSRWEANYARYLEWLRINNEIKDWLHEPDTFWFEDIKRGVRSYLPDFKVTENNGDIKYHEVKGWLDPRSKTKLKRMKKYYPEIDLIVIFSKDYHDIQKNVGRMIDGWE